ncbi:MAG: LytTR family DNA-binding domain-containing protein [Chitinophagales bacterium]|nr:LytTR family DNA-binding domain-containing protein [Chitinophagales bacterium]
MKLKCIVIDDEPRAIEILEDYIKQIPFLKRLASFRNPLKGFEYLKRNNVDIVFLDINMPNLSGIEFIKALTKRPLIILTTAYSEYAVESYGLDVLDYLLKPIEFNRFFKAINKAIDDLNKPRIEVNPAEPDSKYAFIKDGNQLVKVNLEQVLYIEASGNYQAVFKRDGKILSLIQMDELLKLFNNSRFIRVHKSYAVNMDNIDAIENHRIKIGKKIIPIGETFRSIFYAALQ